MKLVLLLIKFGYESDFEFYSLVHIIFIHDVWLKSLFVKCIFNKRWYAYNQICFYFSKNIALCLIYHCYFCYFDSNVSQSCFFLNFYPIRLIFTMTTIVSGKINECRKPFFWGHKLQLIDDKLIILILCQNVF